MTQQATTGIGAQVKVNIDGRELTVPFNTTILKAARDAGIRIPTLCYHEDLCISGSCRMCVVEVEGQRTLQAACAYPITQTLNVKTTSPTIRRARKHILELLLGEHYGDCYTCKRNGNCELQDVASTVGMDHSRFPYRYPQRTVDSSHQQFSIDHHRCILCTRCVRVCDEIEAAHVWDVGYRGSSCSTIAGLDQPWGEVAACTNCGKCVDVCPTGAIVRKDDTTAEKHPHRERPLLLRQAREQHRWHPTGDPLS